MRFWLLFIQSLPISNLENIEVDNIINFDNNLPKINTNFRTNIIQIPLTNTSNLGQINIGNLSFFGGLIGGLVLLLVLAVWGYTRVYVVTPNNEAFVRNGGFFAKEKKVILNGGCIVIPGIHELTRVPLREISIDVVRQGNLAVRTKDYLRANMRVTFYVCISADKDAVLTAAQRLSKVGKISAEDIKDALEKRADDAIRAAAKKSPRTSETASGEGFGSHRELTRTENLMEVGSSRKRQADPSVL
jgi:hypothetical protein